MPLITFTDKVDSKVSTAPIINKIVADDINQLKNGVNANETAISAISGLPYTSLVQLLTQTGTNAPVATEVYNNTGQTFTWTRQSAGNYTITASSALFTVNKTIVFLNNGSTANVTQVPWNRVGDTIVTLSLGTDDRLINGSFEVRIYS